MSANLTSEMSNIDRVVILINECRKMKIDVNPPDVNVSSIDFRPVNNNTISFGLNAIKNVGTKALEQIIESRQDKKKYKSIFDFTANVALKTVNKKVLESLIMSGAMDSLEGNRAQKFNEIEVALKYGQSEQDAKSKNQVDLFGGSAGSTSNQSMIPTLSEVEEWPESKMLENEKEVLGMYISGHPLLKYADDLEEHSNFDFTEKINPRNQDKVRIGGAISDLKLHFDKKNNQMAFFKLDCLGGQAEILVFSSVFSKYKDLVKNDSVVFVKGKQTDETDFSDLKLIAEEIVTVEKAKEIYSKNINIKIDLSNANLDIVKISKLAKDHKGKCGLMFHTSGENGRMQRIIAHNIKVSSSKSFLNEVRDICGKKNVWISE